MKQRYNESKAQFKQRVAVNLPVGKTQKNATATDWVIARYKTTHPRLTNKVHFRVTNKLPRGHAAYAESSDYPEIGETVKDWLARKPKVQRIVAKPTRNRQLAAFYMAHELRHIADNRGQTNARIRQDFRQEKHIPYNFRPKEWRANFAGAKAAGRVLSEEMPHISAKTGARIWKGAIAAGSVAKGILPAVATASTATATAVLYKRHLKKKKAAAAAKTA